ncbi:unnamed protein product, partial [Ectocarpus sp. 4 AP-2014]
QQDPAARKPSQQSHRITSRRALMHNGGPKWAAKTMTNRVKRAALVYTTSRVCMLLLSLATLSSCLFYILATYVHDRAWVRHIETGFGIVFLVDYSLTVAAAPMPLTYALGKGGLIDLVSCLPAFGSFLPWMASFSFVRYLRVGKAIRVMRNHKLLSSIFSNDDVTIKATLLIVKVIGVVMMTSAILYGVERGPTDGEGTGAFNEPGWQWHDAFYFTIVTLSTVGCASSSSRSRTSRWRWASWWTLSTRDPSFAQGSRTPSSASICTSCWPCRARTARTASSTPTCWRDAWLSSSTMTRRLATCRCGLSSWRPHPRARRSLPCAASPSTGPE